MAESKRTEFLKRCEELTFEGGDLKSSVSEIENIAKGLGLQIDFGWVVYAGNAHDGTLSVQFHGRDHQYVSRWPEWAFNSARAALLHDKKLWVISDGAPFGNNLIQTSISNTDAPS